MRFRVRSWVSCPQRCTLSDKCSGMRTHLQGSQDIHNINSQSIQECLPRLSLCEVVGVIDGEYGTCEAHPYRYYL